MKRNQTITEYINELVKILSGFTPEQISLFRSAVQDLQRQEQEKVSLGRAE